MRRRERRWEENWKQWKNSLGQRTLKKRSYYKTIPKKKTISHAFINLMGNIQKYNTKKIQIVWEGLCKICIVLSRGHVIAGDRYTD